MEQSLQKTNSQLANISQCEIKLVKKLVHVNCLASYPISDSMLEIWAKSILKLRPEITPEILESIIDKMKLGEIKYDWRIGIQNIFLAYKSTEKASSPDYQAFLNG